MTKERARRGSGSSLSSIWRSFRGRNKDAHATANTVANANNALVPVLQQSPPPLPPPPLAIGPPPSVTPSAPMPVIPGQIDPLQPPTSLEGTERSDLSDTRSRSPSRSPMERPRTLSQSSVRHTSVSFTSSIQPLPPLTGDIFSCIRGQRPFRDGSFCSKQSEFCGNSTCAFMSEIVW